VATAYQRHSRHFRECLNMCTYLAAVSERLSLALRWAESKRRDVCNHHGPRGYPNSSVGVVRGPAVRRIDVRPTASHSPRSHVEWSVETIPTFRCGCYLPIDKRRQGWNSLVAVWGFVGDGEMWLDVRRFCERMFQRFTAKGHQDMSTFQSQNRPSGLWLVGEAELCLDWG